MYQELYRRSNPSCVPSKEGWFGIICGDGNEISTISVTRVQKTSKRERKEYLDEIVGLKGLQELEYEKE